MHFTLWKVAVVRDTPSLSTHSTWLFVLCITHICQFCDLRFITIAKNKNVWNKSLPFPEIPLWDWTPVIGVPCVDRGGEVATLVRCARLRRSMATWKGGGGGGGHPCGTKRCLPRQPISDRKIHFYRGTKKLYTYTTLKIASDSFIPLLSICRLPHRNPALLICKPWRAGGKGWFVIGDVFWLVAVD